MNKLKRNDEFSKRKKTNSQKYHDAYEKRVK